jgi:hypothetical protein
MPRVFDMRGWLRAVISAREGNRSRLGRIKV